MKILLSSLFLFFTAFLFSQNELILKGKVVDDTDGGIPSASLYLLNNRVGTYTELDGEFSLSISKEFAKDTLVVSSLGFDKRYIPVQVLLSTGHMIIQLTESVELLGEVSISFDKKENDPFRIVREMLKRRITNYPTEPHSYGLFYRAAYRENGKYVHYVEALKEVYDRSFGVEFTKKADVLEGYRAIRRTADSSSYMVAGDQDRFAMTVMKSWDEIRTSVLLLDDNVLANWVFKLDSVWFEDDVDMFYTISGTHSKSASSAGSTELFKLPDVIVMTIQADKYALRKLECSYQIKRWLPNMRDTRGYSVKAISSNSVHEFQWVNDRLYLDRVFFKDNYQVFQRKTDSVLANYSIEDEAFFTGLIPPGSETSEILSFPYDHQFKYPYELYKEAGAYDASLWMDSVKYDSEFYQAIIADLGKPETLEKEFVEQGKRAVAYQVCYDKYRYEIIPLDEKEVIMEKCIQGEMKE